MRGTDEILHAMDKETAIAEAIIEVFQESIAHNQGQHDLDRCRICHQEQNWGGNGRGWALTHKDDCPVGKAQKLLAEFDDFGYLPSNPQPEG